MINLPDTSYIIKVNKTTDFKGNTSNWRVWFYPSNYLFEIF